MIRLAVFGTSTFGLPAFEAIRLDQRFSLVGVVTQPAKPVGRHQAETDTPVAAWAKDHHLPCLTPATLRTAEVQQKLQGLQADIFVVAAYGLILPAAVLTIPSHGCLNIHASLLPRHRGASPIAAAIAAGDSVTGITLMVMDAGCDTGPILQTWSESIKPTDTRPELEQRLAALAGQHIADELDAYVQGRLSAQPQDVTQATTASKLTRQDGRADWQDAAELERRGRAFTPWPGLWTTWNDRELKILSAQVVSVQHSAPAGTVIAHQDGWAIVCRHGLLIPTTVQFSGRKPQPAATIPSGYPGFIGSQLGATV